MSVQQLDQLAPKTFEEDGYFNSMLYINYEKYNAMKKESADSSELRLSIDLSGTPIQNCLSKELLKQIDSPCNDYKTNDTEIDSLALDDLTTDGASLKNFSPNKVNIKPISFSPVSKINKVSVKGKKKNKKTFVERDGDWTCFYCKNLNFSFRKKCNRCKASKDSSEKEHDRYMENLLMIINENERKRKSSSL